MMTSEERINALHAKMDALRRARERRKTGAVGAASIALTLCLLFMIFSGGIHPGGAAGMYSGATMLFEGAGPYVLIAVVAFMAGVIVTVALIRSRRKDTGGTHEDMKTAETKEDETHRERQLPKGGNHDA